MLKSLMDNRVARLLSTGLCMAVALVGLSIAEADAAEDAAPPKDQSWSFEGPFGTFDRGQLQRGFKVYREVCAACHSIDLVAFRNLGQPGGPEFSEAAVRTIASEFQVQDGPDEFGEMFDRPGTPADRFPSPFPNEQAARAAMGGALPPDLSVMVKARPHGAEYIYSLLTGYQDPPPGVELSPGMFYNPYFPGGQIAMVPPFSDGQVEYTDGMPETVQQYAHDVTAFMTWIAEPHLEARKRIGFQVMIFLIVFAGLLYLTKQKLWRAVH